MLTSFKRIQWMSLGARDGEFGKVADLYFDDEDWTVRYLVADTGTWLPGRKVLLSPHSLGPAEGAEKRIPVRLTQEQIRNAPSPDTDRPVSRQFEETFNAYYGYPAYWQGPHVWGGVTFPFYSVDLLTPDAEAADAGEGRPSRRSEARKGDPHLRSAREVQGYHVLSQDGEFGHIEDFILDARDWTIRYLAVNSRNWLPGKTVAIPAEWAAEIRWEEQKVAVGRFRSEILDGPEFDLSRLGREYEEALDRFYGMHARG